MAKKTFKITVDDKELDIAVKEPNVSQRKDSMIVYNKSCRRYMEDGLFTRSSLERHMRDNGTWDDEKQAEYNKLQKILIDNERKLTLGGIKASEGKEIAIEMVKARRSLANLLIERNNYDNMTAEGLATNDKFNYLVSVCTVYNDTGKRVFSSLENYEERAEEPLSIQSASTLAEMLYNIDQDFEANLPENRFLRKFKFIDDEMRFINKEGKLVNVDGELVDEEGRLIDSDGNLIEDSNNNIEPQPFLDDDGNPILED